MAEKRRVDGRTPNGGDYSEIIFLDDSGNVVDEGAASRCVIRECLEDGTLVNETWGVVTQ